MVRGRSFHPLNRPPFATPDPLVARRRATFRHGATETVVLHHSCLLVWAMPLYLTASHSSRVRKPATKAPSLGRSSSSSFAGHARVKPASRPKSKSIDETARDDEDGQPLDDVGLVSSLGRGLSINNVVDAIRHARSTMFADIPEQRSGMNSTRIAEVLNFRQSLPPVVSVAHVHALVKASTKTEREIAELMTTGILRKIIISGRGNDISGFGEHLVLVEDLERRVREDASLDDVLKGA